MKVKSEDHGALSLLFQWDGVLPTKIVTQEMILGEFNGKLKDTSCHLRQTEPFIPLLNAADIKIKKLKNGSVTKFIKSSSP